MDICYLCRLLINGDSDVVDDEDLTHAANVLMFPQHRARAPMTLRGD
jgi:hypothetical protein